MSDVDARVAWFCPGCGHYRAAGLVETRDTCKVRQTRGGWGYLCECDCPGAALAFAVRVYRERFRAVPESMSQVRRLGAQGNDRGKR